ncbi:MAG TPA: hypothetical protein VL381_04295 [Rhodocyclaceae bacterium]|nr:hypothetical protein [Rhodocyclaceae bacterium]
MSLSRSRAILLAFVAGNLALVLAFPPHDYISLQYRNVPTFEGFFPWFMAQPNHQVNFDFLSLELLVVLLNGGIGYLLTGLSMVNAPVHTRRMRKLLIFVACNLILILLFPPFADYRSISTNFIPSFEGFYFVFANNSTRHLVSELLFMEIAMLLVNAGLVWLILKESALQTQNFGRV